MGAEHCVVHGAIRCVVSDLAAGFLKSVKAEQGTSQSEPFALRDLWSS